MATVAVVNRHRIASNRKGANDPVIRVSKGKHGKPSYTNVLAFEGKGRLIYNPEAPLPCGATCWLELE